jgi:hypothetical protein
MTTDVSEHALKIKDLSRKLCWLLAPTSRPDLDQIALVAVELRIASADVQRWANEKRIHGN